MQRDGEVDRQALATERIDARHHAARRDRQAPRADAELLWIDEGAHRRERRVVVVERLPHPHVHDVRDTLAAGRELALPVPDLVDDLARGEISHETHLTGRAERAGHRAAGLRRNAHRVSCAVTRHEHALDVVPVAEHEQHLAGLAIRARLLAHGLDGRPPKRSGERIAEGLREIGQRFDPPFGAMGRVPADLLSAVPGLTVLCQPRDELLSAEVTNGWTDVGHLIERSGAAQDGTRSSGRTSRSPRAQSAPLIARLPAGLTASSRSHPAPAATCGLPSRISIVPCAVPCPGAIDARSTPIRCPRNITNAPGSGVYARTPRTSSSAGRAKSSSPSRGSSFGASVTRLRSCGRRTSFPAR